MRTIIRPALTLALAMISLGWNEHLQAQDTFQWSGFYLGGNVGGNWSHYDVGDFADDVTFKPVGLPERTIHVPVPGFSKTEGSFLGGGQLGYNFQLGQFVVGLEGDFDGTSTSTSGSILVLNGGLAPSALTAERSLESNWTGSARVRAGFAWQRFLFYGTAGGAFADVKVTAKDSFSPGALSFTASDDRAVAGWTAGLGADFAVTHGVTVGLEYRHSGFGRESYNFSEGGSQINSHATSVGFSEDQVTVRVNLLFNGLMGR